jgi:hypothetical protein
MVFALFRLTSTVFLAALSSDLIRSRIHPLVSLFSSSEFHSAPPAAIRRWRAPSLGSCFSFAASRRESTFQWGPIPIYVPPSVFLTLSTVCSSLHFAGLFRSATTSEISLQGFPPAISRPSFHSLVPSCRLTSSGGVSPSGCWSDCRSVAWVLREILFALARSPLEFRLPRVFLCAP